MLAMWILFDGIRSMKMALTNKREEAICKKYSARDETDHVHCFECPLSKSQGKYDARCKANSHYNRHTKEWEYDD